MYRRDGAAGQRGARRGALELGSGGVFGFFLPWTAPTHPEPPHGAPGGRLEETECRSCPPSTSKPAHVVVVRLLERGRAGRVIRRRLMEAAQEEGRPLTRQALCAWRKLKRGVPPQRVAVVAWVLGLQTSQVRPDLFARTSLEAIASQPRRSA